MRIPYWLLYLVIIGVGVIILGLSGFKLTEGFKAGEAGIRCGVDLATCSPGSQCINGFCMAPVKPALPPNQLPVYP
jgi:hypothetical protein